jgi:hypothetical protein
MDKPHLVLDWIFDVENNILSCEIADDLKYIAHEGGTLPFTKIYKGETTKVSVTDWSEFEKYWISDKYGELVGYYQPDFSREIIHPVTKAKDECPNGLGPDGRYLDFLQRMQVIMEGNDMARVWGGGVEPMFLTPDQGKTIYKRMPTRDVNYPAAKTDPDVVWTEWPQPCGMQPRSPGPRLSNYDEMTEAGVPNVIVNQCRAGAWALPLNPELQKHYIYPTV